MLISILTIINVITFVLYWHDKQCARKGNWRVAEITLLSFSFFGGALGAYIAMHGFRHKTQHKKFQICVPLFLTIQIILLIINL